MHHPFEASTQVGSFSISGVLKPAQVLGGKREGNNVEDRLAICETAAFTYATRGEQKSPPALASSCHSHVCHAFPR